MPCIPTPELNRQAFDNLLRGAVIHVAQVCPSIAQDTRAQRLVALSMIETRWHQPYKILTHEEREEVRTVARTHNDVGFLTAFWTAATMVAAIGTKRRMSSLEIRNRLVEVTQQL